MKSVVANLAAGGESADMEEAFAFIMSGKAEQVLIADFLTALYQRGETAADIAAAAKVMRRQMVPVAAPADAIDVCGTGGDMKSTLNISTAVALVVAACGVVVAKHGNRAQSSQSGSADLLEALGVNLAATHVARMIEKIGIGFMFAQNHHPAMKKVAPTRKQLGFRTIFNLIGPLCNPASVRRQLIGVFDQKWVVPIAEALQQLDYTHAWVVHGGDGMDELTTTTTNYVAELKEGNIKTFEVDPTRLGIARVASDALKGGSVADNRRQFEALLRGEKSAYRDIVLLNSAAALIIAGKVDDLAKGMTLAATGLDQHAGDLLEKWVALSHG